MSKNNSINGGDYIIILFILAGVTFAVFSTKTAYIAIGLAVSLIAIVSLIYSMSKKKITHSKVNVNPRTNQAKQQPVVAKSTQSDTTNAKVGTTPTETEKKSKTDSAVSKPANPATNINVEPNPKPNTIHPEPKSNTAKDMNQKDTQAQRKEFTYQDEFSGMRIVGKISGEKAVTKDKYSEEDILRQKESQKEFDNKSSEEIKKEIRYRNEGIDIPISVFTEFDPLLGSEPRREFEYFLSKILLLIRSVTKTRSAFFMLLDTSSSRLLIESYVTSVPEKVTKNGYLDIGKDAVSKIALSGKPEILKEINHSAEPDLFPFYSEAIGISSFIGVPVIYDGAVAGILCAESSEENAYDASTIAFFGHFTKIISGLIRSYYQNHTLLQSAKIMETINKLSDFANDPEGKKTIYEALSETVKSTFDFSVSGCVGYDGTSDKWLVAATNGADFAGSEINTENSLTAKSIIEAASVLSHSKDTNAVFLFDDEPDTFTSFIAVPIRSDKSVFGVIFGFSEVRHELTDYNISVLETLGKHAGESIEKNHLYSLYQNTCLEDAPTGAMNDTAFVKRLDEEVERSKYFKQDLSVCFIKLDEYESLKDNLPHLRAVVNEVASVINGHLRKFDAFGRLDMDQFGICLVNTKDSSAKLWAEKLRNEIANTSFEVEGRKYNVTASFGIAEVGADESLEQISENTTKALTIAIQKKNYVHIYE